MKPVLFSFTAPLIGEVTFPAYFTLLTLGFLVAALVTARQAPKLKLDRELIIDANLWMVVWGLIGARVLHLIADGHFHDYVNLCVNPKAVPSIDALVSYCTADAQCGYDYLCDLGRHVCYPPKDCFAALEVWRGGLAYYGGFLFAVAFAVYFLRRHKMPFFRVADLASPAIALGLFFGRLGCYFNGCCFGKETASRFGVVFPRGSDAWRAQVEAGKITSSGVARAVHPTQLYEAVACLAIAAFLHFVVGKRRRFEGEVFAAFLILYAIARSAVEVFRDDDRGVLFGFLSTSQILSVPLAGLGIYLIWRLRRPMPRPAID